MSHTCIKGCPCVASVVVTTSLETYTTSQESEHKISLGNDESIILSSELELDGQNIQAFLTTSKFSWFLNAVNVKNKPSKNITVPHKITTYSIPLSNIILAHYVRKPDNKKRKTKNESEKQKNEIELFPGQYFNIEFAQKCRGSKLKHQSLTFHTTDSGQCQTWVDNFRNILSAFNRPKHLLVFINPVGGKKQGKKIFYEKVAPLFDLAEIKQTIIVTERANHAKDFLKKEDLSDYDGVVSVGGDGMFSEVMNGLLSYENGSHDASFNGRGKQLIVGIIPAGSPLDSVVVRETGVFDPKKLTNDDGDCEELSQQFKRLLHFMNLNILAANHRDNALAQFQEFLQSSTDTVVYCTMGTSDVLTATLHIVLGDHLPMDICSVWQADMFLKYSVSMMGYGYFGDLLKESEKFRWMGPKRYDYAGFKKFFGHRSYEGEVSFIESQDTFDEENKKCRTGCKRCAFFTDSVDSSVPDAEESWKSIQGRFISVIGTNISCKCARTPTGMSPHAHIGDGHIDLVLIRKASRAKYLHHLIKVSQKTSSHFDFPFIETYRVKEFRFKAIFNNNDISKSTNDINEDLTLTNDVSVWNVDGEVVEFPDITVRVHRQLLTVYASGIEE